jgi:cytochrome P450
VTAELQLGSPEFWADPYPTWAELRAEAPVHWWEVGQAWVVLDYEHVAAVLRDDEHYSPSRRYWEHYVDAEPDAQSLHDRVFETGLFHVPHDDHVRLRRLVMKAFTPRGVEDQRAYVEGEVDRLLAGRGPDGTFDITAGLAVPLPARVIGHLLGVPDEDCDRFKTIADAMIKGLDPTVFDASRAEIDASVAELIDVIDRTIASLDPDRDTLLGRLVRVEEEGDRLSHDELISLVVTILVAGSDTTVHAISLGALSLLQHRSVLDELLAEPERWDAAVMELLRYSFIGSGVVRYVREPTTLAGHPLDRGAMVILNLSAAHHDPAVFAEPTSLDLDHDLQRAILFGVGSHYCVGAALARLEVATALRRFFERFPDAALDGEPTWGDHLVLRGLKHLPVRLHPTDGRTR